VGIRREDEGVHEHEHEHEHRHGPVVPVGCRWRGGRDRDRTCDVRRVKATLCH
jgi:hypothetical protein